MLRHALLLLAALACGPALAQSPGAIFFPDPQITPTAQQVTPAAVALAVNQSLAAKLDLCAKAAGAPNCRPMTAVLADSVNVLGWAKGDTVAMPTQCVTAASSPTLYCPGGAFVANGLPQYVLVHGAGPSGTALQAQITSYIDSQHVVMANAAVTPTPLFSATTYSAISAAGTAYVPGVTLTLAGVSGTASTFTLATTKAVSATVQTAGTGGTTGACSFVGTTGTGTLFTGSGTVSGGGLSGSLTIASGGAYTVNPSSIAAEPVVGCNLTGAKVALVMGANGVALATPGAMTTSPSSPVATTSSGAGSGATITFAGYETGSTLYGTDDTSGVTLAAAQAAALNKPLVFPAGLTYWLASQTTSIPLGGNSCLVGAGPATPLAEVGVGSEILISNTATPAFTMSSGACMQGMSVHYPAQDGSSATPVVYPPLFEGSYVPGPTFTGNSFSAVFKLMQFDVGSGSAVGRLIWRDNRAFCISFCFSYLNGAADIESFSGGQWGIAATFPIGGGSGDPFGRNAAYALTNGSVFLVNVGGQTHATIDGLNTTDVFSFGYRYFAHVVSGGLTLSHWTGDYWEGAQILQVDSGGFVSGTQITGGSVYGGGYSTTSTDTLINVVGNATTRSDLSVTGGFEVDSAPGGAIAMGVNGFLSVADAKFFQWGRNVAAAGTSDAIYADGTGGFAQLIVKGSTFYNYTTPTSVTLNGVFAGSMYQLDVETNSFGYTYFPVETQGFSGTEVVTGNTATNTIGPACVYDVNYSTTFADVGLNNCDVPESNIWHPSQGNSVTGIVAHAGGGAASATLLTGKVNVVSTVASSNDSVALPPAIGKGCITLTNSGANTLTAFGNPTPNHGSTADTINGAASATVAAGKTAWWCSPATGAWTGGSLS